MWLGKSMSESQLVWDIRKERQEVPEKDPLVIPFVLLSLSDPPFCFQDALFICSLSGPHYSSV